MSTVDAATVFFGNLDLECQNEDLAQLLEGWEFTKIAIINDSNGCSRGYALVTFASEDVANNAVVYFHDVIFQSRTLEVFEKMSFFVSSLLRKDFPKSHAWCEKMAAPVNMPAPSLLRMLSSGSRQIASTSSTSEITTLLINVSKAYRVGKITAEQKEQMKYLLATGDLAAARQSLEQLTKFRSKKKKQKKNMQSRRHGSGRVMSTRKIKVFSPTTKFSNPRRAKESDLQPVPAVPVIISETVSFLNIRPEELWERCFERVDLAVITPSACMSELTNVIAPSSTQQGQQLPAPRKVTFNDGTVWYTRCIAMSKESSDRYFVQWESWLDTRVGLLNGWTQWQLPCSACLTLKEYGEFSSTQRRNKQPSAMRCRLCVLQHRESIPLFLHRRDSITLIATQSGTSARWGVCFPFPRRSPVEDVRSCASKILSAFEEVRQRMNPNSIMATTTCDVEGEEKRQRHPVLSCTVWSIIFRYLADGHFASTQLVSRRFHRSIVDSFFKLPFPFVPTASFVSSLEATTRRFGPMVQRLVFRPAAHETATAIKFVNAVDQQKRRESKGQSKHALSAKRVFMCSSAACQGQGNAFVPCPFEKSNPRAPSKFWLCKWECACGCGARTSMYSRWILYDSAEDANARAEFERQGWMWCPLCDAGEDYPGATRTAFTSECLRRNHQKSIMGEFVAVVVRNFPNVVALDLSLFPPNADAFGAMAAHQLPVQGAVNLGKIPDDAAAIFKYIDFISCCCDAVTSMKMSFGFGDNKEDGTILDLVTNRCCYLEEINIQVLPKRHNLRLTNLLRAVGNPPGKRGLRSLSLVYNQYDHFELIGKLCPHLETLDLSQSAASEMLFRGPLPSQALVQLLEDCGKSLTSLGMRENSVAMESIESARAIAICCPNLLELDLSGSYGEFSNPMHVINDEIIAVIAQGCTQLQRLGLHLTRTTDESLRSLAQHCHDLRKIDLSGCWGEYDSHYKYDNWGGDWDMLTPQPFTDSGLEALANGCPLLEDLDIYYCAQITDRGIEALAVQCPAIRKISISRCPLLTDTSLHALANGCPLLEDLDMQYCEQITDRGIEAVAKHGSPLRQLVVSGCPLLTDASLHALENGCVNLEKLEVGSRGIATWKGNVVQRRCPSCQRQTTWKGRRVLCQNSKCKHPVGPSGFAPADNVGKQFGDESVMKLCRSGTAVHVVELPKLMVCDEPGVRELEEVMNGLLSNVQLYLQLYLNDVVKPQTWRLYLNDWSTTYVDSENFIWVLEKPNGPRGPDQIQFCIGTFEKKDISIRRFVYREDIVVEERTVDGVISLVDPLSQEVVPLAMLEMIFRLSSGPKIFETDYSEVLLSQKICFQYYVNNYTAEEVSETVSMCEEVPVIFVFDEENANEFEHGMYPDQELRLDSKNNVWKRYPESKYQPTKNLAWRCVGTLKADGSLVRNF